MEVKQRQLKHDIHMIKNRRPTDCRTFSQESYAFREFKKTIHISKFLWGHNLRRASDRI